MKGDVVTAWEQYLHETLETCTFPISEKDGTVSRYWKYAYKDFITPDTLSYYLNFHPFDSSTNTVVVRDFKADPYLLPEIVQVDVERVANQLTPQQREVIDAILLKTPSPNTFIFYIGTCYHLREWYGDNFTEEDSCWELYLPCDLEYVLKTNTYPPLERKDSTP
jgi:hypothetical protein